MTNSTSTGSLGGGSGGKGIAGSLYTDTNASAGPMDHLLSRLQKGRNHRTKGAFGKAGFKRKRRS